MADADRAASGGRSLVAFVLRVGLLLASGLLAAGLVLKVLRGDGSAPALALPPAALPAALGDRLLVLGVEALVATPLVRVLALVGSWARERDWRFVAVGVVVLVVLALAIALGGG